MATKHKMRDTTKWCERCGGEGQLYTSRYGGNDPDVWPIGECPVCEGSGMEPDHSRKGIFVYHNCSRCDHGAKPCVRGGPHRCEYPHARND